ncbi:MAG: HEAT repeat domain-containing protein [Planctomycetota bacterium]|mgnify:CR=1 FL=1
MMNLREKLNPLLYELPRLHLIDTLNEARRKGASIFEQWELIQSKKWIELRGNPETIIEFLPEWKGLLPLVKSAHALIQDSDSLVRSTAAETLRQLQDPRSLPFLLQAVRDVHYRVRRIVLETLGNLGDPQALPFVRISAIDEDGEVRKEALRALGKLNARREITFFLNALKDPYLAVRKEAIQILGMWEEKEATPYLIPLLKEEDPEILENLYQTLGKLGDPEVIPYLNKAIHDNPSLELKKHIQQAIDHIKGV